MSRPDANIFVVHSRFQLLVVQLMLAGLPELAQRDRWLVLDMDGQGLPIDQATWSGLLQLDPPVGGSVLRAGRACRRAIRQVREVLERYQTVSLFVSDTQWPLNNALYGTFVARKGVAGRRAELCNFPDGIGSLQLVYANWRQPLKDVLKIVLGWLGGAPYFWYRGDLMGMEISDRVFSLLPEAIPSLSDRCVMIPSAPSAVGRQDRDACLFLGQSYDNFMRPAEFRELARAAARHTRSLGYGRLFYKPHPREREAGAIEVFREHGFALLDDPRTAEEIFAADPVGCVVSYNSSALVHLKLMYGDAVRCVSIFSDRVLAHLDVEPDAPAKMRAVFALCGVECDE